MGDSDDLFEGVQGDHSEKTKEAQRRDVALTATKQILRRSTFQNVQLATQLPTNAKRQGTMSGHGAGRAALTA